MSEDHYTVDMAGTNIGKRLGAGASSGMWVRLLVGLGLIGVWWPIAWREVRPFSDYYFFPLWLGYIFTVDSLVALRTGSSPMMRSGFRVVWLFLFSVPLWWVFEGFNEFVGNWNYHMPVRYTALEYFLLASLAFSTVVPAVLTTTELVRSFRLDPSKGLPAIRTTKARLIGVHLAGWLMIVLTWLWPRYAFPLVWLSVIFLLDPVVTVLRGRSVASYLGERDWSPVFNLGLGTLICGFFWEMWNFYAMPKWTYDVPIVGFWHVFEMPLLGFTGYLPFGLEIYVVYVLFKRLLRGIEVPDIPVSSRDPIAARTDTPL